MSHQHHHNHVAPTSSQSCRTTSIVSRKLCNELFNLSRTLSKHFCIRLYTLVCVTNSIIPLYNAHVQMILHTYVCRDLYVLYDLSRTLSMHTRIISYTLVCVTNCIISHELYHQLYISSSTEKASPTHQHTTHTCNATH